MGRYRLWDKGPVVETRKERLPHALRWWWWLEHFTVSQPFWLLARVCPHGQIYLSKLSPLGEGLCGDSLRNQGIRLTPRWGIVMGLPISYLLWVTTPQLALVTGLLASHVVCGRPLQNQLISLLAFYIARADGFSYPMGPTAVGFLTAATAMAGELLS
ncbi:hypothetical protein ACEUD0_09795 [Aeromonas veronii]